MTIEQTESDNQKKINNNVTEEKKNNTDDVISEQNKKIHDLKEILLQNQKNIEDIKLRQLANIENIKKDTEEKIKKIKNIETEKFLKKIIPAIDTLEEILKLSNKLDIKNKPIITGIELTLQSLLNILLKLGVTIEDKKNEIFNPDIHDVIERQESNNLKNHILSVLEKGYIFNKVLLRKAKVIISQ